MTFGKYKDQPLKDVPTDYLEWIAAKYEEDLKMFKEELDSR
jgi:uncharacterized protein (DUF3820 family)